MGEYKSVLKKYESMVSREDVTILAGDLLERFGELCTAMRLFSEIWDDMSQVPQEDVDSLRLLAVTLYVRVNTPHMKELGRVMWEVLQQMDEVSTELFATIGVDVVQLEQQYKADAEEAQRRAVGGGVQ